MSINKENIKHLAELSKIRLSQEEIDSLVDEAQGIVQFFDTLSKASEFEADISSRLNLNEAVLDGDRIDRGTDREYEQFIENEKKFLKIPKIFG